MTITNTEFKVCFIEDTVAAARFFKDVHSADMFTLMTDNPT